MKRVLVGLTLIGSIGLLSSCKFNEAISAAMAALKSDATTPSMAETNAARTAQAQAEQAAQAAKTAQAQAEQAAAAAFAAQAKAEQYLSALQNGALTPPGKTVDRSSKRTLEKTRPVNNMTSSHASPPVPVTQKASIVNRPSIPVRAAPPIRAAAPAQPSPIISSTAESLLEAEEADAFETSDNYVARKNIQASKRQPASVGGAAASVDRNRRADNEARFKRALSLFESKDEQENVKLTIIEPDGTKKLREVSVARLGFEGEQRMLARVLSPADLKGAGVLVVATKQRDNQWVYLPSSKQTRKVVVAEQKGVILGSELRYEDFNPSAIRRSSVDLLRQERIEGKSYDVFEVLIPPGTVPYEKAWVWIDPKSEMPIQIEYFAGGEKVKRIEFLDYYKVGDIWRPAKLAIKNLKTKRGTDLEISNVKVNSGLSPDRLSVEALSRVW